MTIKFTDLLSSATFNNGQREQSFAHLDALSCQRLVNQQHVTSTYYQANIKAADWSPTNSPMVIEQP